MRKVIAFGEKKEGKPFSISYRELFAGQLEKLIPGKYKLTIEKLYKKASPDQFGYLYGCVYPLSLIALNDAGYEFTNIEQVDLFWKSLFANTEIVNRETGEIMKLPHTKSDFATIDQMAYCDSIRQYCAEYLGAEIPDPDKDWRRTELE